MTGHPDLRKGRHRLFIPIKHNNAGKELSAATISRWICNTIVDSHAALQNSKSIPGKVKVHEVRAMATTLQQRPSSSNEGWRWSSRGTFTSFYLRNLCPQADSIGTGDCCDFQLR